MKREYLEKAIAEKQQHLSEADSGRLLAEYGIPMVEQGLAKTADEAAALAAGFGGPAVMKACSKDIAHKTDRGLVKLGVSGDKEVRETFEDLSRRGGEGMDGVLVQRMAKGGRELVAGLVRDATFGPCVMFGLGGVYTEALKDVAFRVAPLTERDALEMMDEIKAAGILGEFRGMPAVDRKALADILIAVGKIGTELDMVEEIDVNPLIVEGSKPVAVDALVALSQPAKN